MYAPALITYRSQHSPGWRAAVRQDSRIADLASLGFPGTTRDLQLQVSQWTIGKAIDTFAPMGPGLIPAYLVPDPQKLELITRVNGRVVQQTSTSDMIFSVSEIIAYLSRAITLEPGDIIATGTPAGVGFKREPALFLQAGDTVEVEISSIGLLSNPVVRSADA